MIKKMNKKQKINQTLARGVEKIYPSKKALEKALNSNKKLKIYQGFDPSMPNLHLGNYVGILKLKELQDLGHEIIFLVGDFTGMIGDPTDKSSARKRLTRKQALNNSKAWKKQASRLLSFSGNNPAKIMFNSKWLDKITFKDLIETTSHFTVQQLIQRDFFQQRIKNKKPIYLHEFLYPVMQAIDCVEMDVDMEIGGSDQTFNMLAGRTLMKAVKSKEKFVLTTKLLTDKEGNKVGKTAGNAIFLNNTANDIFGKVMAFPDEVISLGFELLTQLSLKEIKSFNQHPMELKKKLAFKVVKMNYGEIKAQKAQKEFEKVFSKKQLPGKIKTIKTRNQNILDFIVEIGFASSKNQAKRLIQQNAVKIDGKTITDWKMKTGKGVLQVGKRKYIKLI